MKQRERMYCVDSKDAKKHGMTNRAEEEKNLMHFV
jgi:hypothetical protein